MLKKYSQFWSNILLLIDLGIISGVWLFSYHLVSIDNGFKETYHDVVNLLIPILLIWPVIFKNMGLYRGRRIADSFSEIIDIVKASTLAVFALIAATFFLEIQDISRLSFFYFWFISIILLSLERWFFRLALRYVRSRGYNTRRVLVIGAGDLGGRIARKIRTNPWTGMEIIGYLDDYKQIGMLVGDNKILGRISDLDRVVDEYNIDQVFVALPARAYKRFVYINEVLKDKLVDIRIVPDIYQAITLNASIENFEGIPLINLTDSPMYGWSAVLKRVVDIVVSVIALIVLAPLMLLIVIGIKLSSPGPAIFKQRRYGLDGRVIRVYKFRSMTVCEDGPDVPQASKCDIRITPFGSFLRRTSLDELPQFFNVLQGRMSVVGPRPHAIAHNELYRKLISKYMLRHKVKPGITGWAQVNGCRGETDTVAKMENRIQHDLYYIEHWSVWFDLKIMYLTAWKGFVNKNAY